MNKRLLTRTETPVRSSHPQPTERKIVRLRGDESAENAAALWQEGEILNQEGTSRFSIDRHLKTLPPLLVLTDEQFIAATKINLKETSSGTTVEIVVTMPDSVVDLLIQERKMSMLASRELVLEVINFVDEEDAITGSDHIYETVLNNLIFERKITQDQKIYLIGQIRSVFRDYRNIIRNVDISVRDKKNQEVPHNIEPYINFSREDERVATADDYTDGFQGTVADYVAGRSLVEPIGGLRTEQAASETGMEDYLDERRRQREERHKKVRSKNKRNIVGGSQTKQAHTKERSSRRRNNEQEATTVEQAKAFVLLILFFGSIMGQGFVALGVAERLAEMFEGASYYGLMSGILVAQAALSLGYSAVKNRGKDYKHEFDTISSITKEYLVAAIVIALPNLGFIGAYELVQFLHFKALEAVGAVGLPREEQNSKLLEGFLNIAIPAAIIGLFAFAARLGLRQKMKERRAAEAVSKKKVATKEKEVLIGEKTGLSRFLPGRKS